MTLVYTYKWRAYNEEAICLTQNTAGAASLIINGLEALRRDGAPSGVWLSHRIWRVIVIVNNTANDLSGVSFTITGTLGGIPQSETLTGPIANEYKPTTKLFDSVTSVTASQAVTDVSIGTGRSGQTSWFLYNNYPAFAGLGVQVNVLPVVPPLNPPPAIKYTFAHTLLDATAPIITPAMTDSYNVGIIMPNTLVGASFTTVMVDAEVTGYAAFMYPTKYCAIMFKEEQDGGCDAIVNFVQQGLTT